LSLRGADRGGEQNDKGGEEGNPGFLACKIVSQWILD
jgi:hypothetical protein